MTTEERARAAKALQQNPLLDEIFSKAIQQCFDVWQADPNPSDRDTLWHRVKAIQLLRLDINATVKSALRDGQQKSIDA
jgi:hypothetical protein